MTRPNEFMRETLQLVDKINEGMYEPAPASQPRTRQTRRTYPLHDAVKRGDVARVKSLLADGIDPNTLNTKRYPPIMWALQRAYGNRVALTTEHSHAIAELVNAGADINGKGGDRSATALHLAASIGDAGLIRQLVELGADINSKNYDGETPLDYARAGYTKNEEEIVEVLKEMGAEDSSSAIMEMEDEIPQCDCYNHCPKCGFQLKPGIPIEDNADLEQDFADIMNRGVQ